MLVARFSLRLLQGGNEPNNWRCAFGDRSLDLHFMSGNRKDVKKVTTIMSATEPGLPIELRSLLAPSSLGFGNIGYLSSSANSCCRIIPGLDILSSSIAFVVLRL